MYNSKKLYRFTRNNSAYLVYDNDGFNIEELEFKVKVVALM